MIRDKGLDTLVICDTCSKSLPVHTPIALIAHHDATQRHGWVAGTHLPGRPLGIFCPECAALALKESRHE